MLHLVDRLAALSERDRELAAGEVLFRSRDPVTDMFLVVGGAIRLTRTLPHGLQLTLQHAGAGAILAEASFFAERYHCEAMASEPSLLRIVPRRRLASAFVVDRDLAQAWARHLAGEVQRTRAVAEILSLKTVAERLDAWLALNDGATPTHKGRWNQIAAEIGVTPEALYRELARRRGARQGK